MIFTLDEEDVYEMNIPNILGQLNTSHITDCARQVLTLGGRSFSYDKDTTMCTVHDTLRGSYDLQ